VIRIAERGKRYSLVCGTPEFVEEALNDAVSDLSGNYKFEVVSMSTLSIGEPAVCVLAKAIPLAKGQVIMR